MKNKYTIKSLQQLLTDNSIEHTKTSKHAQLLYQAIDAGIYSHVRICFRQKNQNRLTPNTSIYVQYEGIQGKLYTQTTKQGKLSHTTPYIKHQSKLGEIMLSFSNEIIRMESIRLQ